ncbi:MAG: hypothetical protein QXX17_06120 [Conexivisphaerales archaeon]
MNGCTSTELEGSSPPITKGNTLYLVAGFWIWCQSSTGSGNTYGPDFAGSIYVAEVNLLTNTEVYDTTPISGSTTPTAQGTQVNFISSDKDMLCSLVVTPGSSLSPGTCDGLPITFDGVIVRVT